MPNDPAPKPADAAPLLDAEGVRREELERAVAPRRAAWANLKVDIDADVSRLAARLASLGERLAMEDLETARHKAAASDGMVPAAVDAPPPAAAPTGGGPPESAATKPPAAEPEGPAAPARSLFGLALSGGGIRSASFCLGATQALNKHDHLQTADYISSVSGGGYTNGCLAANWHRPDGTVDSSWRFPFAHQRGDIEGPALRHLRAYSNFIAPRGGFQLLHAVTQFLRGVLLNLMALLPWLLFFAGLVHALLVAPPYWCVARWDACAALALGPLKDVALAASLFVLGFALLSRQYRLFLERYAQATGRPFWDGRELFRQHVAIGACAVVATVFVAAQPYLYYALGATLVEKRSLASIGGLAAALALLTKVGSLPAVVRKGAAVVAAALAGPVLLWLGAVGVAKLLEDQGFQEFVKPVVGRLIGDGIPDGSWLFALRIFAVSTVASILLALLIWLLTLYNANEVSPHSFYRDRLSKAFMFGVVNGDRTEPRDSLKLGDLAPRPGALLPYPLFNAALNLGPWRRAEYDNRGRVADFFALTPLRAGSDSTMYCATRGLEAINKRMTLASVVAVSGAAAASAAGRVTNPVLRFLLAMFNVRLGYWTPNPRRVAAGEFATASARLLKRADPGTLYLLKEMTGLVHQDGWLVNLSDGGHVENLGVYELLRRRCRLIVAVDAEQDAAMSYASFGDVVRFAQIDMALKIEIDLDGLRLREEADGYVDKTPVSRRHYAIGTIEYPERPGDPLEPRAFTGVLVYVKTSLCADDPEEIWKYKATHPAFPHDPTVADQFFDEEQFEAYRALGYEAIASLLWDMKDRGI